MVRGPIAWRGRIRPKPQLLHLRVTLDGITPTVWRTAAVSPGITLGKLHRVLQVLFDWTNSHLHYFEFGKLRFSDEDMSDDSIWPEERLGMPYKGIVLSQFELEPGDRFSYVYDMGDDWRHEIVVEALQEGPRSVRPRCLGGVRAAPPDDVGGPHGYMEQLEILKNPRNPEHDDVVAWFPSKFDPEHFDPLATDRRLARLR